MYQNTYLDKVGELMKNCIELTKNVKGSLEEVERLVKELTDSEKIEAMFKADVDCIKELFINGKVSENEAKENLERLKMYVISQLEYHYNLVPTLLNDVQKHLSNKATQKAIQELSTQPKFSEILKQNIEERLNRAGEEIDRIAQDI
jgi:archaellum component FlaC